MTTTVLNKLESKYGCDIEPAAEESDLSLLQVQTTPAALQKIPGIDDCEIFSFSGPVVELLAFIKELGHEAGVELKQDPKEIPYLHFNPGIKIKELEDPARWEMFEYVVGRFEESKKDLKYLISIGAINLS
jgi:hypothetical protein